MCIDAYDMWYNARIAFSPKSEAHSYFYTNSNKLVQS